MYKFKSYLSSCTSCPFPDFASLYTYSITYPSEFWNHTFNYFPLVYSEEQTHTTNNPNPPRQRFVFDESARMDSIPEWFPTISLNFAENILFTGDSAGQPTKTGKEDSKIAVTQVREGGLTPTHPGDKVINLTWSQLRTRVARLSNAMRARGVRRGDRVAVVASNSIDTLTVFLAITALGGLFSSSSTEMGIKGILDRLVQIRPKWVFVDDASVYNGQTLDLRSKMKDIVQGLEREGVREFEGVVAMSRFLEREKDVSDIPKTITLDEFLAAAQGRELVFERVKFSDPFLIVYSSGTTGSPKCIVHSVGGVVLNGFKEGMLHRCLDAGSVALQYTTTGWIMYLAASKYNFSTTPASFYLYLIPTLTPLYVVQALLFASRIILYDGSPFLPNLTSFLHLTSTLQCTHLGISPRYLQELQKAHLRPRELADLNNLRVVTSTGMVLSDQLFEWFYDQAFPPQVQLDNISGGTDIAGAFATGNPLQPVYVGGCQGPSLGTPIAVFDHSVEGGRGVKGVRVEDGVPGELVATRPFPNMPRFFWGDEKGKKYFESYFAKFDDCWVHGDFVQVHPVTGQIVFLGRSDGVLNPSGVRFGSGEIYGVVDARFGGEVADSVCVGQVRRIFRCSRWVIWC